MRELMATFFGEQLDFILFFYGLAFILLGSVCIAVGRSGQTPIAWNILGAFGYLHGALEWLELASLVVGDSADFKLVRLILMVVSFIALLDFGQGELARFGYRVPGRWIYVVLTLLVAFGWSLAGINGAGAFGRYFFALPGSVLAAVVLGMQARGAPWRERRWLYCAITGFALYGFAAGVVVPPTAAWNGDFINYTHFQAATGTPVQLMRGLVACLIAFSIWAYWGERSAAQIGSARYTRFQQRQFVWTLTAMGAILVVGWFITQFLGSIYRQNIEAESGGDLNLISSRISAEIAVADGLLKALANSRSVAALAAGDPNADWDRVSDHLDLEIEATGANQGLIVNAAGRVQTALTRINPSDRSPVGQDLSEVPFVKHALSGVPGHDFTYKQSEKETYYLAAYPIRDPSGHVVGAAVLEKPLRHLDDELAQFDRAFAFVDRDGVVLLSNRSAMLLRTLWPIEPGRSAELSRNYGPLNANPILPHEVTGAKWIQFDASRDYVERRFVAESDWSLVTWKTPQGVFASRVLGIAITLQMVIMVIVYLIGREHWVHDKVQFERRAELEELARDLGTRAATDPLTGLYNRRRFDRSLAAEILRVQRYPAPLSLILWDIDHFKQVNDLYGHQAGDQVLVELSRCVAARIRGTDMLARWGGEEFVILCPESDAGKARLLAQQLLDGIRQVDIPAAGHVTCSFGVAQYREGDTPEALLARADGALYLAKAEGRDRVIVAAETVFEAPSLVPST